MEIFAFCVIIHEPIKIQTCAAPQNDRLNFVFMNDIYVDSKKVARNSSNFVVANFGDHPLDKNSSDSLGRMLRRTRFSKDVLV